MGKQELCPFKFYDIFAYIYFLDTPENACDFGNVLVSGMRAILMRLKLILVMKNIYSSVAL